MVAVPKVQSSHLNPDAAVAFARLTTTVMMAFAAVYGLITIVGGAARWSSPAYDVAMQVPGAPESWGAVLMGAGLLGLLGQAVRALPVMLVGSALCAAWSTCFAFSIGLVAWRIPTVGWGAVVTWLFLAVLFAACTAAGAGRFHAPA